MELNSKQRAALRGLANPLETILQVGKQGIVEHTVTQADEALEKRELIKGCVLETCPLDVRETARTLAERTRSQVVQVIGSRFVLYRRHPKNPQIKL